MIIYDWFYEEVKGVARQYAADTPHWSQLFFPFCLSTLFIFSRRLSERYVYLVLAEILNLRNRRRQRPQRFEVLESDWKAVEDISNVNFQLLTVLGIRFSHGDRTLTQKFCRSGWYCLHYGEACLFAYNSIYKEPWLWNTSLWWYNYPYQIVSTNLWMYYMSNMAFSWSVIQSEIRRMPNLSPDLLCHLCIIVYMSLSWVNGFYRVTAALMIVEDFTNLLREAIKLIKYVNCRIIYRMLLPVYIVVWIYTHLGFFQYWILNSVYMESPETVRESTLQYVYGPLFVYMLAVRYYTAVLLLKGLCQ